MSSFAAGTLSTPGYPSAPGSAKVLAERIVEILLLPVIEVNRTDVPEASYGKIGDARIRFAEVATGEYTVKGPRCQNLIVFEDAIVSGANTARQCKLLGAFGAETFPYCLFDIATPDLTVEESLNAAIISAGNFGFIVNILDNPKSCVVMRTVKVLLTLPKEQLKHLLEEIGVDRAVEIFNIARSNGLSEKATFSVGFTVLREYLAQASRKIRGEVAPFEPMFIVNDANAEAFLASEGGRYSALKYDEGESLSYYANKLVAAIRQRYGSEIDSHPEEFVVASTHFYRVPNASSALGSIVARKLKLAVADMRRKEIFEGEFGALGSREERQQLINGNAYCSNPKVVAGKTILYIDNAVVSGTHLEEHFLALKKCSPKDIGAFAILEVLGSNLSLEARLNYLHVNPESNLELLKILQDPQSATLTRTLKLILRQPKSTFDRLIADISDERLFDIYESAQLEGYGQRPKFASNYMALEYEVGKRQLLANDTLESRLLENVSMMIFDYDDTLGQTLTPLTEEMMDHLLYFMKRGVEIGVVSLQPIGERGLTDTVYNPLRDFLSRQGEELKHLRRLHLLPCEGSLGFKINRSGVFDISKPTYNLGFQPSQWKELQALVRTTAALANATKMFLRDSYI